MWPCTGQLERADLTVIHDVLMPRVMCQYTPAVVAPAAERRPMWWAFAQLGRRIGIDVLPDLDLDTASDDDVLDLALRGARLGLDELRGPGAVGQPVETDRAVFGWVHERVLRDGRWRLAPPELVRQLDEVRSPAPLVLIPQRQVRHQNTQHRRLGDRPYVQIHPVDAAAVDVTDGDQVIVTERDRQCDGYRVRHRRDPCGGGLGTARLGRPVRQHLGERSRRRPAHGHAAAVGHARRVGPSEVTRQLSIPRDPTES